MQRERLEVDTVSKPIVETTVVLYDIVDNP